MIVHCTLCGSEGIGSCSCWVTLRCPHCRRSATVARTPEDPPFGEIEAACPLCIRRAKEGAPKRKAETGSTGT